MQSSNCLLPGSSLPLQEFSAIIEEKSKVCIERVLSGNSHDQKEGEYPYRRQITLT